MNPAINRNGDGHYCLPHPMSGDAIIDLARSIVAESFFRPNKMNRPEETKTFLTLQLGQEEREVFGVIFLDRHNQVIAFEKLFFGTIDMATVHPREVVKRSLQLNAAAVILAHNHPSGLPEPSKTDIEITQRLLQALALVDINLLDHIVVGGTASVSFADQGMI